MSDNPQHKSGKKNRKFGRGLRKPSHNRYTLLRRWETNKARKAAKIKKVLARKAARKAKKAARD